MLENLELNKLNRKYRNHLPFGCNFCIFNFSDRIERNEHIKLHFKKKYCGSCDQILIEIGDEWFELRPHVNEKCKVIEERSKDPHQGDIKIEPQTTNDLVFTIQQVETRDCNEYVDTSALFTVNNSDDDLMKKEPIEVYENEQIDKISCGSPADNNENENHTHNIESNGDDYAESDSNDESLDRDTDQNDDSKALDLINCNLCQKSMNKYRLKRHLLRVHNIQSSYKCRVCGELFISKREVQKHVKDVHQGKGYPCEYCGKTYRDKYSVNRHAERNHFKRDKVICDICSKEMQKEYLSKHMQIHNARDKFKCTHCEKDFHSEPGLKAHIRVVHEGSKMHKCETCGKCFASNGNLKVHRNLHLDIRPFICSYCGHGFNQESNLTEHINIHTGEKPYTCKVCSKTFSQSRQLSAHMRIHTRHKPYKCKIGDCDRAYINAIDMKRHRFSVHGVYTKKHICHICSKVYPEKKMLTKHLGTH